MPLHRREFLALAGGALCAAGLGAGAAEAGRKPNIVLCMADDQGWGDMAYNGHPVLQTPNFDAAAAAGLRFDRFYAAAPVCSPTRGSVMTGRHPNRFGCFTYGHSLRPEEVTLPEALKQAGYATGHFGKWHLGSVEPGSPVSPGASGFDEWLSAPNFYDNDPILSRGGRAEQLEGESSMVAVDAALPFIRKHAEADRPFLVVVWFGSPHNPHEAAPEYRAIYEGERESLRDFYGEITGMDAAFGKLRDGLREMGIHENTILWYCSDNGGLPGLGATGGREDKGDIYEGGLRVPAILEWPARLQAPRATNVPCNTTDIYPTLLDIAGVQVADQPTLDGLSIVGLLDGEMSSRSQPMGFWRYPTKGVTTPSAKLMKELLAAQASGKDVAHPELLPPQGGAAILGTLSVTGTRGAGPEETVYPGHAAWLEWPHKLHRIQDDLGITPVTWELYDLAADPMESRNIVQELPEKVAAMREGLEKWMRSVDESYQGKDYV